MSEIRQFWDLPSPPTATRLHNQRCGSLSHLPVFFERIIEWGYDDAPAPNPIFHGDIPRRHHSKNAFRSYAVASSVYVRASRRGRGSGGAPGHWEGDLVRGTDVSAIATLVERSSRLVLLAKLDAVDADTVAAALREHVLSLPVQLRRSLTWDQGKEMARHA